MQGPSSSYVQDSGHLAPVQRRSMRPTATLRQPGYLHFTGRQHSRHKLRFSAAGRSLNQGKAHYAVIVTSSQPIVGRVGSIIANSRP